MKNFGFKALLCLLFAVLSCGQDPLKGFAQEIKDGALQTGAHNFPLFEEFLYEKFVQINILGRSDLLMEFEEGKASFYHLRVRLLNNLGSKYKLRLKSESFSLLPGAVWRFNPESGEGFWEWRPSQTFTRNQMSKKLSLPLVLEFNEIGSPDKTAFVVKKDLKAIVYKKLDKPDIFKIQTKYNEYIRLDDENFYSNHGAGFLNLRYYDRLFAGSNNRKLEIFESLKFYSAETYAKFSVSAYPAPSSYQWITTLDERGFDSFNIQDKFKKPVPFDLLDFINQPLYYELAKKGGGADCAADMKVFQDGEKALCLKKVSAPVMFSQNIYARRYKIPKGIPPENLFYKITNAYLCEAYHHISLKYGLNNRAPWNQKEECYLSAEKAYNIQEGVQEKEDIYLLKGNGAIELVDKSQWKAYFYLLPESVKWRLGGFQPVPGGLLKINLLKSRGLAGASNVFSVYVRDYNYSSKAPVLSPYQEPNKFLFWAPPAEKDIDIQWILASSSRLSESEWKMTYNIDLRDRREQSYFSQFEISLYPISEAISGSAVALAFNILPSVTVKSSESLDLDSLSFSAQSTVANGQKSWVSSSLSLSGNIKSQYVFPSGFLSKIHEAVPHNSPPFNEGESLKGLLAFLDIDQSQPVSNYKRLNPGDSPSLSGESNFISPDVFAFRENYFSCSEFSESFTNQKVYIERDCSYNLNLKLEPGFLKKQNGELRSAYWRYDYSLAGASSVFLKSKFYTKAEPGVPLSLNLEPLAYQYEPPFFSPKKRESYIHIFFNLKPAPDLQCSSVSDSPYKTCMIHYALDDIAPGTPAVKEKELGKMSRLNSFFSQDRGMAIYLSFSEEGGSGAFAPCLRPNVSSYKLKAPSKCFCGRPSFSEEGIRVECSFEKSQQGLLSAYWATNSPYIYFLSASAEHNERPESYKKTPRAVFYMR